VTRPKLEKRRQTLIHLGFGSSQGGLGAAIEMALGRTLQCLLFDAVIVARAASSGVGRTTSARY